MSEGINIENIYRIYNTVDGKSYVGQTTDPEARIRAHFLKLAGGRHDARKMQAAYKEYGGNAFQVETLEVVSIREADERERFWVAHFNSHKDGYNKTKGGANNHNLIRTPEYCALCDEYNRVWGEYVERGKEIQAIVRQMEKEREHLYQRMKELEKLKKQQLKEDNPK